MSCLKPLFLLAGGSFGNTKAMLPLLSRALNECGHKPRIAYIGTASGDNKIFYMMIRSLLKEAGAADVNLVRLAKTKPDLAAAKRTLEAADAIFISGGEVEDGMGWLQKHGLAHHLNELRVSGKLFIGLSAGSIMMGSHWVHWDDPKDDSTAALFDCLGFAATTFDTHAEDEDWKELKTALLLQGPGARGFGIPRDGMAVVDREGNIEAVGKPLLCFENIDSEVKRTDNG